MTKPDYSQLSEFEAAYVECALWASTTDEGEPLDNDHGYDDLSGDCVSRMLEDCKAFVHDNAGALDEALNVRPSYDDSHAGHDFWLTRNRHGAGFWDRGLGDIGTRLSDAAKVYGECNLYVGDDGTIHMA